MIQHDVTRETIKIQEVIKISERTSFDFKPDRENIIDSFTGMPKALPVYRFLNQNTETYFYTACEIQRSLVEKLDNFSFKGTAFFAYSIEVEGSIPIYRFHDPYSGEHFDTLSIIETDNLAKFRFKGIAYYALPI